MKNLRDTLKMHVPFSSKQLAIREIGRSHLVIVALVMLSLFLTLNSLYNYVDLSDSKVGALVVTMCVLLGLMLVVSVSIALRAYGATKKR